MKRLELSTRAVDKTIHVTLHGDVVAGNAAVLQAALQADVPASARDVRLDMSGVRRVDTAGLAVMVDFAASRGGGVSLVSVPPAVCRILELLGGHAGVLRIHSRLEDAVPGLNPARLHDPTRRLTPS